MINISGLVEYKNKFKPTGWLEWKRLLAGVGLALLVNLVLANSTLASGPQGSPSKDGQQVSLVSTNVTCVVVEAGTPQSVSATVRLEWEGQIDQAFLLLAVGGTQVPHSIYVNGQRVAGAPTRPDDQPCQLQDPISILSRTDMIPIPAEILVPGENVITLTNDANMNNGWTAANLHLEIHGVLSGPPVALLEGDSSVSGIGIIAAATPLSVTLTSSYGDPQQVVTWYQVPDNYSGTPGNPATGSPTPLLIGLHGYGGTGEDVIKGAMATEANTRGWLIAAPDMHGKDSPTVGDYALAWPGAQHDIIDSIIYMRANYNVDTSRIYIAGGSMGGQTSAVMAAKYPDIFAAAAFWKPITDLTDLYNELSTDINRFGWFLRTIRLETDLNCEANGPYPYTYNPVNCGTPTVVPFEYQRRSAAQMPQNSRLIPLKMWHDIQDELVAASHSDKLKAAVNSWAPPTPVDLRKVDTGNLCQDDYKHCYMPPPLENSFLPTVTQTIDPPGGPVGNLFDLLQGFTLDSQPPLSLTIRTDESKPYYWLKITQTGGDHWTEVEAAYSPTDKTLTATISDVQPLTLAFNLGSAPVAGLAGIPHAGMGLPPGTYSVKGGGNDYQANYTSGYFTVTLTTTGQFTLTIAAVDGGTSSSVYLPIVIR